MSVTSKTYYLQKSYLFSQLKGNHKNTIIRHRVTSLPRLPLKMSDYIENILNYSKTRGGLLLKLIKILVYFLI
jgi:hypothetical protein